MVLSPHHLLLEILALVIVRRIAWLSSSFNRPVSTIVKDITVGAGSLGINSWAGQVGLSVTNDSPSVGSLFATVVRTLNRDILFTFWRTTASIMKFDLNFSLSFALVSTKILLSRIL